MIEIELRFQRLADKIDSLIEKEQSTLPEGVELMVWNKSDLHNFHGVKGKYIGFAFILDKGTNLLTSGEGISVEPVEVLPLGKPVKQEYSLY